MDLRIDRLATLYIVQRLRRYASNGKLSIPILMYHSVAEEDETAIHPYYRTATSPAMFGAQMAALAHAGYAALTLPQAVSWLTEALPQSRQSVVITFDDGYRNFHANAFPVLQQHGFTATMFLPTAYIGESNLTFNGRECLSWREVRELQKHGIGFGSHTVTHPKLYGLDPREIRREIRDSKQSIEQKLGVRVESFAYPYAFPETDSRFRQQLRNLLGEAGYSSGVCTAVGRPDGAADPLFLKRLPINSCDDRSLFAAKLAGSYDWIAKPQYLVKMAKQWAKSVKA